MKRLAFLLSLLVVSTNFISIADAATAKTTISFAVESTPNAGESLVTFYGQVKPAAKGSIIISSFDGVTWKNTPLKTTSSSSGSWRITTIATAIKAEGQYKAMVTIGKKKIISKAANFKVDNSRTYIDTNSLLIPGGPGGRIHGADVSRWQHPCLLYTSPSPRDRQKSRMPSSA